MTTLRDLLAARVRRPSVTLRLAGRLQSGVLRVRTAHAYGSDGIGSGSVTLRSPSADPQQGQTIAWSWGFNGYEVAAFTGYVVDVQKVSYPDTWELSVRDALWLASREQREIATDPLNDVEAGAAIAQILAGAGVTRLALPTIPRPSGGAWTLGTLTPVSWSKTTALAACQDICKAAGYWLYADAGGVVRAAQIERRPSDSPAWSFLDGRDFLEDSPPTRRRDGSQVRNRITVRGASTGVEGAQLWDTFTATHALYPGVVAEDEYSSGLLEYEADVTAVAERLAGLLNRSPDSVSFATLFNPYLALAQTIAVRDPYIGLAAPRAYFVYSADKEIDLQTGQARMSITADGGMGSSGYSLLSPPVAAMAWRLVKEGLDGADVVEVFLDGSGSASMSGGEIVAWAWHSATATQAGYSASATGARAMFVYPATTAAAHITLTVTDTSSKTGTVSQDIALAGDALSPLTSRTISLALGSAWAVSADGGATWGVEASGDSTLVPEVGGPQLLSTRASGSTGLRGTRDALGTASSSLASLGGAVTALAQTVDSPDRVWAAVGAAVRLSTDGGATFAAWGALPATVTGILEDPAQLGSVFFLSGADLYHGAGDVLYAGPVGATARHLARGLSGATTWVAYTGTFTDSPLQRVEGPILATFPLGSTVTEIRAIALSPDELYVYAWDGAGAAWKVDSATGIATAIPGGDLPAGATAQHAIHDPDDPIVYVATFGPTEGPAYKYFPLIDALATLYTPASGQQCHRIGISDATPFPGTLIVPPYGESGAADKVWRWRDGAWVGLTPPQGGWYWRHCAANPSNRDEWLLLGSEGTATHRYTQSGGALVSYPGGQPALYRTTDAGATWAAVPLALPAGTPAGATLYAYQVEFSPVGASSWALNFNIDVGADQPSGLIVGAAGAVAGGFYDAATNARNMSRLCAGVGGDWVTESNPYLGGAGASSYAWRVAPGASSYGAVGGARPSGIATGERRLERLPGASTVVCEVGVGGTQDGRLSVTADYRSAAPADAIDVDGAWLCAAAHGLYIGGRSGGVLRIADPTAASLSGSVVGAAGSAVGVIRCDRQTRGYVAALGSGVVYVSVDGINWRAIGLPALSSAPQALEVVG